MERITDRKLFYGYFIVASCFLIQAIGIGTHVSYGVFFSSLISEFGWSRATLSGASSVVFFLMGFLGIFVGRFNDRVGPKSIMGITGFFFGMGYILMSWIGTVWQLYLVYGLIIGIGMSSIDVIALSTTARWFTRKRGIMTGIVKVGTGFGQLTIPFIASILIAGYGWRNAYLIIGGASLLLLISISRLLRKDPSSTGPSQDNCPEKIARTAREMREGLSLRNMLRNREFWTICGASLACVYCFISIIVHIVPHANDIMRSASRSAGVLSLIGGVSMAGRITMGFLIDRMGTKKTMILCFAILTAVLLWLQIAREPWMLYLFAIFYGVAHGGFYTVISPIVADLFGIRAHGFLFGIVAFSGNVGGSIGPLITGYIFDITGGYMIAFWICALMSAIGLALIISLRQGLSHAAGIKNLSSRR